MRRTLPCWLMGHRLCPVDFCSLFSGISLLSAKEQLGLSKKEKQIFWSHAGAKDRLHNELFSSCIEQGTSVTERKMYHLKNSLFPQLTEAIKGQADWETPGQNYSQLQNFRSNVSRPWWPQGAGGWKAMWIYYNLCVTYGLAVYH